MGGLECERNPSADTEVSEEGGEEVRRRRGCPCSPWWDGTAGCPPQPMEGSGEGEAPQDGRDSVGKPALEQCVAEDRPAERTHTREVCEELQPVELTLEKFVKNCLPWEGPHGGAREE